MLLRQLTLREVRARYQTTSLGIFWAFFTPLVTLGIYTIVFGTIFKGRWMVDGEAVDGVFPLVVLCGLTAYNIFSESINASTRMIIGNKNYVKKVVFPLEILPVASLLAAIYFALIWFLIAIVGVGVMLHQVHVTALALPLVLVPLIFLSAGLCWFFASLGVYLRDVPHMVNILLLVMLYMTGIFYSPGILPPLYQRLVYLNPLAVIVEQVRRVLIFGQWPDWWGLAGLTVVSLLLAQIGYTWFIRTKKGFADVI